MCIYNINAMTFNYTLLSCSPVAKVLPGQQVVDLVLQPWFYSICPHMLGFWRPGQGLVLDLLLNGICGLAGHIIPLGQGLSVDQAVL